MSKLTSEELAILGSVELGEWKSVSDLPEEIARFQQYAQSQVGELATISIELPTDDLKTLRAIAQETDTSVTLLVASLLHQYAESQSFS